MGATVVVDNLAGGSGAKAMAAARQAKPDGGMFYATTPTFVYTSLLSRPPASYRDLEPLVNIFFDPEVLYTAANSRFKTLQRRDRSRAQRRGRWGAANPASLERQTMERMKQKAGVAPVVATFEGGGDMLINVLNHTLDMGIGELQEIRAQLDAGTRAPARRRRRRAPAAVSRRDDRRRSRGSICRSASSGARRARRARRAEVIAAWEAAVPKLLADPAYKRDLHEEQPAARLHPARGVRDVHERLRRADRSLPQGVRRHPVNRASRSWMLASKVTASRLACGTLLAARRCTT